MQVDSDVLSHRGLLLFRGFLLQDRACSDLTRGGGPAPSSHQEGVPILSSMVIHFICRGNTHRSRLAAVYAKSLTQELDDVTVLSSGIEADRDLNGPIVPFVKLLLQNENLLQFAGASWTQTTQSMIDDSDVLIFMSDDVYEDAIKRFDIPLAISQTWQVPDKQGVDGRIKSAVEVLLSQLKIMSPGP